MILRRYISLTVLRPFFGILAFFLALHFAWWATKLISAGGAASMTPGEFLLVISLQSLTAMEVLLPVSLFLAIISGLGQLASTQEAMAIRATGSGDRLLLSSIVVIALLATSLIALESLWVRAQAFGEIYKISAAIDQDTDFKRIDGGQFYTSHMQDDASGDGSSTRVIFADEREGDELKQVFVARSRNGRNEFIFADSARQQTDENGQRQMTFDNGYLYQIAENEDAGKDWHIGFNSMSLDMAPAETPAIATKRKSRTTASLSSSPLAFEIAEFQGRFAAPLSTLLLALLAVPLSRFAPRKGRYGRIIFAAILMLVYFNLYSLARTLMESGVMPIFPGVFWPHLLLLAVLAGMFWPQKQPAHRRLSSARA